MMTVEEALERVRSHLGTSKRATHSIFVGYAMKRLAQVYGANAPLWEVVGLCHDLDFFETYGDRRKHGILVAEWLAQELPADALEGIRSHDHRTGIEANTPLADALKLADALAIADEIIGREAVVQLLDNDKEVELRNALTTRPHLPDMMIRYTRRLDITMPDLALICSRAPAQ
jgi:predicted hydrolase (HD superfamily)